MCSQVVRVQGVLLGVKCFSVDACIYAAYFPSDCHDFVVDNVQRCERMIITGYSAFIRVITIITNNSKNASGYRSTASKGREGNSHGLLTAI